MENWVIQILGWIAAFIFGVLINLASPSIQSFFQKSALSYRNRRIKAIKDQYELTKVYKDDASKLAVQSSKLMADGFQRLTLFMGICCVIVITGIRIGFQEGSYNFVIAVISIMAGYVSSKFDDVQGVINSTRNFEKYKAKVRARLQKWGGNLEDLDKEETEGG